MLRILSTLRLAVMSTAWLPASRGLVMTTADYRRGVVARISDKLVSLSREQQGAVPPEVQELLQQDGSIKKQTLSDIRKLCAIAEATEPGVQSSASGVSLHELLSRRASLHERVLQPTLQCCKAATKGAGGRKTFHVCSDRVLCDKGPARFTVKVGREKCADRQVQLHEWRLASLAAYRLQLSGLRLGRGRTGSSAAATFTCTETHSMKSSSTGFVIFVLHSQDDGYVHCPWLQTASAGPAKHLWKLDDVPAGERHDKEFRVNIPDWTVVRQQQTSQAIAARNLYVQPYVVDESARSPAVFIATSDSARVSHASDGFSMPRLPQSEDAHRLLPQGFSMQTPASRHPAEHDSAPGTASDAPSSSVSADVMHQKETRSGSGQQPQQHRKRNKPPASNSSGASRQHGIELHIGILHAKVQQLENDMQPVPAMAQRLHELEEHLRKLDSRFAESLNNAEQVEQEFVDQVLNIPDLTEDEEAQV